MRLGLGLDLAATRKRKVSNPFAGITFSLRLEPTATSFFQDTAGLTPATTYLLSFP
jgi:hypothetical protein